MTNESAPVSHESLVVVGSSAGGIEALSTFLGAMSPDFAAPIVIAQHLDPARPSSLPQILERKTTLPVVAVEGRVELERGKVYVVPAGHEVTITDGHIATEGDGHQRPRPSIDHLLTSAARAYGERLIAVILSGSGSDGAAGAIDVKAAGGTVVIQNPATARYPSMPAALPPTLVDHVVDIEQLAPVLTAILEGAALPETHAEDAVRDIVAIVGKQTSLDFEPYKRTTLLRRITRRMAVTRSATIGDYRDYLQQNPQEIGELAMAFLIKVTEFFRDPEAFDFIRNHILPQLIEQARHRGRVLRFWSAGCATGEEPYSLALLVADVLGAELSQWNVKIFATDLDEQAINFARRGTYPENLLTTLPDDYRARFFEQVDAGLQIAKTLRQMVIFGQQDLGRGAPFPRIDLVLCRNLLIYFKPELQQHVLDLFAYSLHYGNGFLFLGKAETARPSKAVFEMVEKRWKVFRCVHGPVPTAAHRLGGALMLQGRPRLAPTPEKPMSTATEGAIEADLVQLRRFTDVVLRSIPLGIVVVDRNYRILTINGAARRLLGIREPGLEQDFLHSIRGLHYNEVRNALDTMFRERTTVTLPDLELDRAVPGVRFLTLTLSPLAVEGSQEVALISTNDQTESVQMRQRLETAQAEQAQLVADLSAANKRLSELNKDLQDANEELQAANEEMMLTQEELQAANEEFEATNEELQATNEELETNNEELQATNEELEATNDELTARTQEVQEALHALAGERVRLGEMIELAPFSIVVLRGPTLTIEACNPKYVALLAGRDYLNRPADEVFRGPELQDVIALVRDAYWKDTVGKATVRLPIEGETKTLLYTAVPTHDGAGKVNGVVVYAEEAP